MSIVILRQVALFWTWVALIVQHRPASALVGSAFGRRTSSSSSLPLGFRCPLGSSQPIFWQYGSPRRPPQLILLLLSSSSSSADKPSVGTSSFSDVNGLRSSQQLLSNAEDTLMDVSSLPLIDNPGPSETIATIPELEQRQMIALLWMAAMLSALDRVAMAVALVPMTNEFGPDVMTDTTKGLISSLFSVGYGVGIIPAGLWIAQASPRSVMATGMALWSTATLLTPAATEYAASQAVMIPLLVARATVGLGESIVMPTIQRVLTVWTQPDQKSRAIAMVFSGFQAGTIAAYLLSPWVMDAWEWGVADWTGTRPWEGLFYLYGSLGAALLVPWWIWAQDSPSSVPSPNGDQTDINRVNARSDSQTLATTKVAMDLPFRPDSSLSQSSIWDKSRRILREAPWKDFARSPGTWAMLLAHCAKNWGLYNTLAWTPTFYAEQYDLGVRDSAWLSVLPGLAGTAGGLVAGVLADSMLQRHEQERGEMSDEYRTMLRKGFQSIGLLGPALVLGSLAVHIPEQAWVAQWFLTASFAMQSFNAAGFEAANQEKAGQRWAGLLYSITTLPAVVVGTVGVYVTGRVLDLTQQDWTLVFALNAAVNIVGASAFLWLYNAKREFD